MAPFLCSAALIIILIPIQIFYLPAEVGEMKSNDSTKFDDDSQSKERIGGPTANQNKHRHDVIDDDDLCDRNEPIRLKSDEYRISISSSVTNHEITLARKGPSLQF